MKLLKNKLIKLAKGGFSDRVLFVDNIPEHLLYEMRHPMKYFPRTAEMDQHKGPDLTAEKVPTLYQGTYNSPTGDGAIVFELDNANGQERWKKVWNFIRSSFPPHEVAPQPKIYSTDPTDSKAGPISVDQIPRAVLPVLSPPSADTKVEAEVGTVQTAAGLDLEAVKQKAVEDYKAELKLKRQRNAAAAREAKQAKK